MGLSSLSRLILLASHCMVLTRERKNSSRIAREMEIFSIFAFFSIACETQRAKSVTKIIYLGPLPIGPPLSPCWSQSITRDFKFSASHSVDHDDRLTFMKHLVQRKSQFPRRMLFLCLAQKQVQISRRHFSLILGFRSPNFAQRNQRG